MSESTRVIGILATLLGAYLVLGVFIWLTRHNQKLRFFVLMPISVIGLLWLGFSKGWSTADLLIFGLMLLSAVSGCFSLIRSNAKKLPNVPSVLESDSKLRN